MQVMPKGDLVLAKVAEAEERTQGGILLPGSAQAPVWRWLYTAAANGFYANTLANKWIVRFWPATPAAPKSLLDGAAK